MTTTVDYRVLELSLTEAARWSAARMSGTSYRRADTGAWCAPTVPHVPGCTCQPGEVGCKTCWRAYLRHVANSPVT